MTTSPDIPASEADAHGAAALRAARRALTAPTVGPLVALAVAMAFFSWKTDRFLDTDNLSLILQQVMVIGVLAIGQTLVILTAGIDLSIGAVMALGQIVMTKVAFDSGIHPVLAILLGMLVSIGFGALNGALVTVVRLPAFIVTLGTLNIAFALTHIYSKDETIADVPSQLTFLGRPLSIGGTAFTYGVPVMLGLFVVVWYALTKTAWGRHVYAVGDNAEAARLTGIKTGRVLLSVYTLAGLFAGIAGLLLVGRLGVGDPNVGQTDNLDSITAVVLGGTSLFGGRGSIIGTLIGVVIVGVFRNGLQLMGVAAIYQILITGILVILAVSADRITQARRQ